MNDLLNLAMKAHGGLERWKQVRNMQAKVTLNGTLWRIKGRPDGLSGVVMRLNTKAARSYHHSVSEARNGGALYSQPRLD